MNSNYGTDLVVLPYFTAHDAAEVDLVRVQTRIRGPQLAGTNPYDLQTFSGRENLAQALILRLLTPKGSLAALGHAEYGSQLYRLIGERKTEALRNLCRAYVLEAVAQEPRVEPKAVALIFDLLAETLSSFAFTLEVKPRQDGGAESSPISLNLEVGI